MNTRMVDSIVVEEGTPTFSQGALNITGSSTFTVATGRTLNINSGVKGSNELKLGGPGTVNLSSFNTHIGGTRMIDGALGLGHKNTLGTGTLTIGDTTLAPTVELKLSATTNLTGANAIANAVTINRSFNFTGSNNLELSGIVGLAGSNRQINLNTASVLTLSGVINNGGLTVAGAGNLILTAANTYTGDTIIDGNVTALAKGSLASNVAVNQGSFGAGAPNIGGGTIGTLGLTQSMSFTGGGFAYDFDSSSTSADLINLSGNLSLGSAVASLSITDIGSTAMPFGTKFTMINYGGTWDGGTFDGGYTNGKVFTVGSNLLRLLYDDATGGSNSGGGALGNGSRYVTLTVVPETSSLPVLAQGIIVAVGAVSNRSRRRVCVSG
jgi:autotransporter-associated beta strand protein